MMSGYQRFKQMGMQLKGDKPDEGLDVDNPYTNRPLLELIDLRTKATLWIEENHSHPAIKTARTRLRKINYAINNHPPDAAIFEVPLPDEPEAI